MSKQTVSDPSSVKCCAVLMDDIWPPVKQFLHKWQRLAFVSPTFNDSAMLGRSTTTQCSCTSRCKQPSSHVTSHLLFSYLVSWSLTSLFSTNMATSEMNKPFVLLAYVILLRHVDKVDHWLGCDKQVLVQLLNLLRAHTHTSMHVSHTALHSTAALVFTHHTDQTTYHHHTILVEVELRSYVPLDTK